MSGRRATHGLNSPAGTDWVDGFCLLQLNKKYHPFTIFSGIEITLDIECEALDFLVLGLHDPRLEDPKPKSEHRRWIYTYLHKFVHTHGGFLVYAHPFRFNAETPEEVMNLTGQETMNRADPGHNSANHGQNTSHHGQYQEVVDDSKNSDRTQVDASWTPGDNHETIISPKRLQNFDRTSGAILRTIRQSPDLSQVAVAWASLPPTVRMAILNLIKPHTDKATNRSKIA